MTNICGQSWLLRKLTGYSNLLSKNKIQVIQMDDGISWTKSEYIT